jgi:transcription initiation factor TFIIE subunit alpha
MQNNPLDVLRALVARVSRAFYDAPYVAILDVLSRNPSVKDLDVANYLKLSTKQLRSFTDRLKQDKLIKQEARQEIRLDGKLHHRIWYYIDYKQFVDVVKYKLAMMDRSLQKKIVEAEQSQGYICHSCGTSFEAWQAMQLPMDMSQGGNFICEHCNGLLEEKINNDTGNNQELARLFAKQVEPILELYRQTDRMVIPEYRPVEKVDLKAKAEQELAIAQGTMTEEPTSVHVDFNDDAKSQIVSKDDLRQQNALPIWHQISTITGKRYDEGLTSPTLPSPTRRDSSNIDAAPEVKIEQEEETAKIVRDYYASLTNQPVVPEGEVELSDDEFVQVEPSFVHGDSVKREREDDDLEKDRKRVKLEDSDEDEFIEV